MTDGALSKPIPQEVKDLAEVFIPFSVVDDHWKWRQAISYAILAERRRCHNIIDAECEWGGDLREAQRKIDAGEGPRRIPGWNAPSDED